MLVSLLRAFCIAGAQTVLASHWKVSDKVTSRLMMKFVRQWQAGEPRAQAWREAGSGLLENLTPRARGWYNGGAERERNAYENP